MKELGRTCIFFSTDKEHWTEEYTGNHIEYSEPHDDVIEEIMYENINKHFNFDIHKPWLFNKKEYKYREIGILKGAFRDDVIYVYPNEMLYVKFTWESLESSCTMDELSRKLPANVFLEYLKDHGVNVVEKQ